MFGLSNTYTTEKFRGPLASNSEGSIKYISLNNWSYPARPTLVNRNSIQPL